MTPNRPMVIAANWKMHKTGREVEPYFASFRQAAPRNGVVRIVFFPPAPILAAVARAADGIAHAGAQNCHWEEEGAYTGEISVPMIAAAGARLVLVGHSERRQMFGETDETCAKKVEAVLSGGLEAMLCVGETLEEREAGRQRAVVIRQLTRGLDRLPEIHDAAGRLLIAYEPVWAIGTGRTASAGDAQEMHEAIREALITLVGAGPAERVPILYGGSVKGGSAGELLGRSDVDGALVGGASLSPDEFAVIAAAGAERAKREA
ncbi:MAG: triose-phosphate isomerase [Gemmatimonadota bacterium]